MTTIVKFLNNRYVLGVLLTAGLLVDLILIGLECDLNKSDWGTWVGSIGTVGALIGAIWVATADRRAKRQERLDYALIAAAGLVARLPLIIKALLRARTTLTTPLDQSDDVNHMLAKAFSFMEEANLWSAEELVPLVFLPNQTAAKLSWIGMKVRGTKARLEIYRDADIEWDAIPLVTRGLIYELTSSVGHITSALTQCTDFLLEHGFENAVPRYEPHADVGNNDNLTGVQ
jgi:hypothetical protein